MATSSQAAEPQPSQAVPQPQYREEGAYYSEALVQKYGLLPFESLPDPRYNYKARISYLPNLNHFTARAAATIQIEGLSGSTIPSGFPTVVRGPMVWGPASFVDESQWIYQLDQAELEEIDTALQYFKQQNLVWTEVNQTNFPLPKLGESLTKLGEDVYSGIGCKIVRGLDVDKYKDGEDLGSIFLAVSSYIAPVRGRQDQTGTMIHHVVDVGKLDRQADMPFHTDVTCDVVATLTRDCSSIGGDLRMASGATVYNELAASRPDLLHVLSQEDWAFDTFGRTPNFYRRALLYNSDGKPIFNFSRRLLTGNLYMARSVDIPGLNEKQAEALDAVHYTAQSHQVSVSMKKGDIRFINNMGILHGRQAFDDTDVSSEDYSKRHLMRLWLHNPEKCWKLAPSLQLSWDRVFAADDPRPVQWDAEPITKDGKILRPAKSSCD